MLDRTKYFLIHTLVHVFLYLLPRCVHTLLVKLPVTLWQLVTGRRPLTYASLTERRITVVTSATNSAAGARLLQTFGLSKDMLYRGPLYHGDIHTVLGAMAVGHRVAYERELPESLDGNPICLEWLKVPKGTEASGVIFIVPGVGNYGQTPFIQRMVRSAVSKGFHVCLLVPRGMGSAPLTQPRLTCITFTQDVRVVMQRLLTRDALRARFGEDLPLFMLGFSAGGTTIMKASVEELNAYHADPSRYQGGFPVKALVSMEAPYNMFTHADAIANSHFYYQQPMLDALRKYALKHAAVFSKGLSGLPDIRDKAHLVEMLSNLKNVNDFNERLVAPHFGYGEGAAGYYKDAAAFKWLEQLDASLPVVCLAARNDPITGNSHSVAEWQALADAHPNVVYVETPVGGHLSFLPGPIDVLRQCGDFLIDFPLHIFQHAVRTGKDKAE